MATKIVTKNSSTASAVPTASDLVQGELAVNVADKKLFTEDNSGAIVELADGVKLAGIEASADVTDTANVTAAGALMDSELTSIASVKALNQGVATTDSPAFAGLTVDTDTLAVDSTNNRVGIGTASPVTDLDVRNNISMGDGTSVTNLSMTRNSANYITASNATGYLAFRTGGSTERMRIDSSGNVGIGTTTPASFAGDCTLALNESGGARLGLNGSSRFFYMGCDSGSDRLEIGRRISSNTADSPDFVLSGSGQVGIGTSSPSSKLSIHGSAGDAYLSQTNTANSQRLELGNAYSLITGGSGSVSAVASDNTLAFATADTERMRIDSSGNASFNTTNIAPASNNVYGTAILQYGGASMSRVNSTTLDLNRSSSDGAIIQFRKDGTGVGSIGIKTGRPYFAQSGNMGIACSGVSLLPTDGNGSAIDNTNDIGFSSLRWDDIYATNGTIQTSDRNEKQDIAELSDAEQRVAVACKGLLRKFRWKDSVAEKGDDARTHFGIIAQDLQAAFVAEGLDAGDYAMFISSTWTDEETNEEKTRMGVRYSELLAFIISAI